MATTIAFVTLNPSSIPDASSRTKPCKVNVAGRREPRSLVNTVAGAAADSRLGAPSELSVPGMLFQTTRGREPPPPENGVGKTVRPTPSSVSVSVADVGSPQGVIKDFGSTSPLGFSTTNAVVLRVE